MLPPWLSLIKDELHVFIRPQAIILKRFKGVCGFKLSLVDYQNKTLKNGLMKHEIDIEGHHLSEYLQNVLNDKRWKAKSATVVLSSYFVRYVAVPWNAEIKTDEEFQAYLNHQFVSTFGDVISSWNKCHNKVEYGHGTLASAIQGELLRTVHDAFSSACIKLDAVQPDLMKIANQVRSTIKEKRLTQGCWLAVISDGRLCLCLIIGSEWCFVKCLQVEENTVVQIEMLIRREMLLNNAIAKTIKENGELPMLLHWVGAPISEGMKINDCRIIKLTSPLVVPKGIEKRAVKMGLT